MICYKDKSFCTAICDTKQCDRNFNADIQAKADEWWATWSTPGPAPISFYAYHRRCNEYRRPGHMKPPEGVDSRPQHGMVPI